jgi:histidyl-tRNA synthetase
VVRAYLASGSQIPMKLAYAGPMFRYERPQAGRRRQFWQVGVEYLGEDSPAADVEVIELGFRFYEAIGLTGLEVQLNTLGDPASRAAHREALVSFLSGIEDDLSADSRDRIATNPLRVFDSKEDRHKLVGAPMPLDYLSPESADHYDAVKRGLDQAAVPYVENPLLVRGLDYYTRTVFEYVATDLDAAQNAVGGGGRYDQLAEVLGGRHVPAVGFSLGIDRIVLALGDEDEPPPALDAFVVVADETRRDLAAGLVRDLRDQALRVDIEPTARSVKAQFKAADRRRAQTAIVVGDEWDDGEVTIRDLFRGVETRVANTAESIVGHIQSGGKPS